MCFSRRSYFFPCWKQQQINVHPRGDISEKRSVIDDPTTQNFADGQPQPFENPP